VTVAFAPVTLVAMTSKFTPEEVALLVKKAHAVSDVAMDVAYGWESIADKEAAANAINSAFDAMQQHSDVVLRNVVLATLKDLSERDHIAQLQHVGVFIRISIDSALQSKTPLPWLELRSLPDTLFGDVFQAWRTNDKNLWPSTAVFLEKIGFPRVSPDALRIAWMRHLKRL